MRQLIKGRELVEDGWFYAGVDEGEATGPVALLLADYVAARAAGADVSATAVRLVPADADVSPLAPFIATLPLVVVDFPSTGDGRGYTQASLLRGRYGYKGELRASGKGVRVDQIYFLARCGFDTFELAEGEKAQVAIAQLDRFTVAYQDSPDGLVRPRHRYGS
ncbi:MAG: DUF934 domain-containing protein [Steroidobacteraceae bacterium]